MKRNPRRKTTTPGKAAADPISYVESLPDVGERLHKIQKATTLIIAAANGIDECIGVSDEDVIDAILALAQDARYEVRMLENHLPADVLSMDAPNDDQVRARAEGAR